MMSMPMDHFDAHWRIQSLFAIASEALYERPLTGSMVFPMDCSAVL